MSTVAAIATPNAPGGIGIIRISGGDAFKIADSVFKPVSSKKLSELKGYTSAFGHVYDSGGLVDECIAAVFKAPKSYTGEDVVELSCHGGLYVTNRVLRAVLSAGALPAGAGEFTKRAFLNGRIDLTEAEGVMNIISAKGKDALNAAVTALDGALSRRIACVCGALTHLAAGMAVWTDYPDEDVPEVHADSLSAELENISNDLDGLISSFEAGHAITEGISTVICGHPNVGKSTLMNLLAGRDCSIVTDIAGTTRDVIEETVRLGSAVLRLQDTAGLRDSRDEIENIGVSMARQRIECAELVIAVFDASLALSDEDINLLKKCSEKRTVAVINKTDLGINIDADIIKKYIPAAVEMSAFDGGGLDLLKNAVEKMLSLDTLDSSAAMLTTERQRMCCVRAKACVDEAVEALKSGMTLDAVNVGVDSAVDALNELTGKKATETVVDEVFSKFCVGK